MSKKTLHARPLSKGEALKAAGMCEAGDCLPAPDVSLVGRLVRLRADLSASLDVSARVASTLLSCPDGQGVGTQKDASVDALLADIESLASALGCDLRTIDRAVGSFGHDHPEKDCHP